jgi:hypothetical protein
MVRYITRTSVRTGSLQQLPYFSKLESGWEGLNTNILDLGIRVWRPLKKQKRPPKGAPLLDGLPTCLVFETPLVGEFESLVDLSDSVL